MDHSLNTLRAAIKSLTDVVAPAVDRQDPLATEQLRLVTESLVFLGERIPYLHARSHIELSIVLNLAKQLLPYAGEVSPEIESIMREHVQEGEALANSTKAQGPQLDSATFRLRADARELIRAANDAGEQTRTAIETAAVNSAEGSMEFYRSWYRSLGFDPRPNDVRELGEVVDALINQ